mmetsp:Transcript_9962/g.16312  ORF Transcript_9962/g.16312 Transcript_9962/m.16312 type:complete len:80 (-) Transcript_9962:535-774(-)
MRSTFTTSVWLVDVQEFHELVRSTTRRPCLQVWHIRCFYMSGKGLNAFSSATIMKRRASEQNILFAPQLPELIFELLFD